MLANLRTRVEQVGICEDCSDNRQVLIVGVGQLAEMQCTLGALAENRLVEVGSRLSSRGQLGALAKARVWQNLKKKSAPPNCYSTQNPVLYIMSLQFVIGQ